MHPSTIRLERGYSEVIVWIGVVDLFEGIIKTIAITIQLVGSVPPSISCRSPNVSLSLSGLFGSVPFCCSSKSFSPSSSESGLLGLIQMFLLRNRKAHPHPNLFVQWLLWCLWSQSLCLNILCQSKPQHG